tara:strand:+ start:87 stop:1916 length:1830 start_codon:yes stop_codon:yes gene_type:complete
MAVQGIKGGGIGQVAIPTAEEALRQQYLTPISEIARRRAQNVAAGALPTTADVVGEVPEQFFQPDTQLGAIGNDFLIGLSNIGQFGTDLMRAPFEIGRIAYEGAGELGSGLGEVLKQPTERKMKEIIEQQGPGVEADLSPFREAVRRQGQQAPELISMEDPYQVGEKQFDGIEFDAQNAINNLEQGLSGDVRDGDDLGTAVTATEDDTTETLPSPMETLLENSMKEFNEGLGKETKGMSIEDYKKQFSDATGVDVSGKVDKSHALMALGLSLMQNKAGKGFDVSKALSALGEAGEAAMPAFQKAKEQAMAAQIAGGKFAINKVASDKAAQVAAQKAKLDNINALKKSLAEGQEKQILKMVEGAETRKTERLKSELKIFEEAQKPADEREYDKNFDLTFAAGQGPATGWQIKMAYDKTKPDQAVLVNADPMVRKYIDGRGGIDDALDLISEMEQAATEIAEGGGTAKFAFDRVNSIAKALFPDLNTGQPTSEAEYTQKVNIIMGRFKRFLTQETGNGISNKDVEVWERDIMAKPGFFSNLDKTTSALDLLRDTFLQKREEFDAGLDHLYNADNHRDQNAFTKLVDKYGTIDQIKGLEGRLIFKDGRLVRG